MLGPTAHTDTFSRDGLPPRDQWPDFLLDGFDYPDHLNAGVELTDAMVAKGFGDHTALIGNGRRRTYKELTDWTNRLAHVLVEDLGVKPETVVEMEARMSSQDVAFDLQDPDDDEGHMSFAPAAYLADRRNEPAAQLETADSEAYQHDRLVQALGELDGRSQDILQRRWLNEQKETLHELADTYGVSAERIRQIEKAAMKKLKAALLA